jgi:hypothetical protein
MAENRTVIYRPPGPIAKSFMESAAFIRGLMGPVGSGKSSVCVMELLRRAQLQAVSPDGRRHTRFVVVRNTVPDLKNTTMKTWMDWIPPQWGKLNLSSPITHRITNDKLDMEVIFLGLDKDEDVRKLMSLETTGLWINEARYIPKSILDGAIERVGRYPARKDGGATWRGVIMDTNPPDTEHWWYKMAEHVDPELDIQLDELSEKLIAKGAIERGQPLVEFFKQPSGLSPEAENIENLTPGYYELACVGKSPDHIKVQIHGEYGFIVDGRPVYPMYRDSTHTANVVLQPHPGLPILVGADLGLTPAGVFGQRLVDGRWVVLDELVTDDCGVTRFAELMAAFAARQYPGYAIGGAWLDPAGMTRGHDEDTAQDILRAVTGWNWQPAPTNDFDIRREAVINPLNRMVDGNPGLLVSPSCSMVRKGMTGDYHFKFVRTSNGAQVHETPAKNKFSHPCEAVQYLVLGGGEYELVRGRSPDRHKRLPAVAQGTGASPFSDDKRQTSGGRFQTAADITAWRQRRTHPEAVRRTRPDYDTDDVFER